jgi:hypothetical protein
MAENPEIKAWQDGGPTPPGMEIRCSGCRDCVRDGHLPLNSTKPMEPTPAERLARMETIRHQHDVNGCKVEPCVVCDEYFEHLKVMYEDFRKGGNHP